MKKQKKKELIILLITLVVAIICVVLIFKLDLVGKPNKENITTTSTTSLISEYHASLLATGDGLIHSTVYNAAYKNNKYDFSNMLTIIKDYIKDFDIKYYNQETISDPSRAYSNYPSFNTPNEFQQNMIDIGFNLVSLASNHSYDMGEASARKSTSWWESKTDILATGMATSEEKRNTPKIMEVNGITYTMLSYTYGTNGAKATESYLINYFDEEQVKKDIAAVRDQVDVLIVAMHWGTEYKLDENDTQRKQAKFLSDNGVDIVLGNHSHCVEPFEKIGSTYVFYSFGNFISNQMGSDVVNEQRVGSTGLMGMLDIKKTVNNKTHESSIKIDNIRAELIYTYRYKDSETNNGYNYRVVPYSKLDINAKNSLMELNGVNDLNVLYDKYVKVLTKYSNEISVIKMK